MTQSFVELPPTWSQKLSIPKIGEINETLFLCLRVTQEGRKCEIMWMWSFRLLKLLWNSDFEPNYKFHAQREPENIKRPYHWIQCSLILVYMGDSGRYQVSNNGDSYVWGKIDAVTQCNVTVTLYWHLKTIFSLVNYFYHLHISDWLGVVGNNNEKHV